MTSSSTRIAIVAFRVKDIHGNIFDATVDWVKAALGIKSSST